MYSTTSKSKNIYTIVWHTINVVIANIACPNNGIMGAVMIGGHFRNNESSLVSDYGSKSVS